MAGGLALFTTALGRCGIGWTACGVAVVRLPEADDDRQLAGLRRLLPGAARAVGHALGRNPVPIVVPCHRVLAAGGRSGGFSAPGGVRTKYALLAAEGAAVPAVQQALPFD